MRVLHAAETIKGGVATVLRQLAKSQIADKGQENICCLVPADQASELYGVDSRSIKSFPRLGRGIRGFLQFFFIFTRVVLKHRPKVVHLHSSFAGALGRLSLILLWPIYRPKVIYCPHAFAFMMTVSRFKSRIYTVIEKLLLPITDVVICVSHCEKKIAVDAGLNENKLVVVHNGVPSNDNYAKKVNSFESNELIQLLFVGRFDYQKGFDILSKAMRQLEGKAFHLTVVGDFVLENENDKIQDLPQTTYAGWLSAEQLAPHFCRADVLLIPSRWEGFAMVPLEAMSYGLPILASNCSSFPEVVDDHINGRLFSPEQTEELCHILESTSREEWQRMGNAARDTFSKRFTADKMIAATKKVYLDLGA
ncbi:MULTISPECIES: glycosyltransferase [Serratia]|uniref:glycosyltransferase n=1 Tax=Serratia TaxID=613 RepID=UPI0009B0CD16|nr:MULTISPECIES: glycosyltransferase [Serratia]QHI77429.1 glycosyltransferase [Serratia sp. NGAS9]EMB2733565.1 glycosyltransferase [Serratia marcescens]MBH2536422.1 glycosyltransferase [Serratia marcescens]MBH2624740.1 glycosyltransferase [Serratia marcescens]MBH2714015.1 glycosyltransferase [Serratia marcescens]